MDDERITTTASDKDACRRIIERESSFNYDATADADMIDIHRPAFTQHDLDAFYGYKAEDERTCCEQTRQCCRDNCSCSGACLKAAVLSKLPFIHTFQIYQWRSWFLWDLLAGISVGVIHIPQSMGFAILANVPPVYGLYSTFFQCVIYFFFATSRHISIGTMAVPSIMVSAVISRQLDKLPAELTNPVSNSTGNGTTDFDEDAFKLDIAVSVTLIMGCFQVLLSVLRLGILATFMSMAFVGSFLCGAACIIITSQVPSMLGLSLPKYTGAFNLPLNWYTILSHLPETNPAEVVISVVCLAFLIVVKMIINEKIKEKARLKVPIPAELIIVVVGTIASHYGEFAEKYDVTVVGDIPKGMPAPSVPSLHDAQDYILDGLIIAIVSFAISVSMAKMFSQKYRYPIDSNQEMLAYGLAYGGSSFFSSFAGAQAPPRTLVHDGTGGKTQLASLWSALLVLLVCLFLGPLFYNLPKSVLASVIVIALLPLFKQFLDLKVYWHVNKYDLLVWVVTFLSVVIIDISYGLVIGIGLSLLTVVSQSYFVQGVGIDGHGKASEIYLQKDIYKDASPVPEGIYIFSFESQLFFANIDRFKSQLFEYTGINPSLILAGQRPKVVEEVEVKWSHEGSENFETHGISLKAVTQTNETISTTTTQGKDNTESASESSQVTLDLDNQKNATQEPANGKTSNGKMSSTNFHSNGDGHLTASCDVSKMVVIDCSSITYCDIMALNFLKQLRADYKELGIKFALAGCSYNMLRKLQRGGYIGQDGLTKEDMVFPSVHDAVVAHKKAQPVVIA